jgi:hypothetical protein
LNSKATKDFVRMFETQKELKKRANFGKTFMHPLQKFSNAETGDINTARSFNQSVTVTESTEKLLVPRSPVLNRTARQTTMHKDNEQPYAYGLKDQTNETHFSKAFRRSFKDKTEEKIDVKGSREYLIKSIEKLKPSRASKSHDSPSPVVKVKTEVLSNYRPPKYVFQNNQNFNDFYNVPSSRRLRGLAIENLKQYSKEETEVAVMSRVSYNESFLSNLKIQQAEKTVQKILQFYSGDHKPESTKRRHSVLDSSPTIPKGMRKLDKENDLKYQIYLDLEKSAAESKKDLEKSFTSLTEKSLKGDPRPSLKKGITGATGVYLDKLIAKAKAVKEEELERLKMKEARRLQERTSFVRQPTLNNKKNTVYNPKTVVVDSSRPFGNPV